MLSSLRIRNLALVPDLTLDLRPGLNVVTGETGAGKSVILGAIQLVLGQRADRTSIRAGADLCSVEAVFHASRCQGSIDAILADAGLDPCEAGALVIRRTFTTSGTNRQFVNGSPTTLATLSNLGQWLVDLHGPHDHQSLLEPARQLSILDAFAGLSPLRSSFANAIHQRNSLRHHLDSLVADPAAIERQRDLLRHQVAEIQMARLQPGEEESLAADYSRANNAARILELSCNLLALLADDDDSLVHRMAAVGRALQELTRLDPALNPASSLHHQASELLRDLQQAIQRHASAVDVDPERLAALSQRLDLLQSLRRKYGPTTEAILRFADKTQAELDELEQREESVARLAQDLQKHLDVLQDLGTQLRRKRQSAAPRLAKATLKELSSLGFQQAEFAVAVEPAPGHDTSPTAGPTGFDQCEFLFAPNPGEPMRPLRAIASSGELARVMLALKTVLAQEDEIPVLVFDEVDANIGGETAHAVGQKLRHIARDHQVLCISHLAPVAAHADAHYAVTKEFRDGRTESCIHQLDEAGRTIELGRMLGGGHPALRHAAELMTTARAPR